MLFPATYFNMARVGIGLYGLWPSKETYLSCLLRKRTPPRLRPVLSWKARIVQVKDVPAGAFVGYGCSYRTTRRTRLAVVPVGYFDGYSRGF
jgi:alanine racemase